MSAICENCIHSTFTTGSFDRCKLAEQLKDKPAGLTGEHYYAVKPYFYFQVHRKASCAQFEEKLKAPVLLWGQKSQIKT